MNEMAYDIADGEDLESIVDNVKVTVTADADNFEADTAVPCEAETDVPCSAETDNYVDASVPCKAETDVYVDALVDASVPCSAETDDVGASVPRKAETDIVGASVPRKAETENDIVDASLPCSAETNVVGTPILCKSEADDSNAVSMPCTATDFHEADGGVAQLESRKEALLKRLRTFMLEEDRTPRTPYATCTLL